MLAWSFLKYAICNQQAKITIKATWWQDIKTSININKQKFTFFRPWEGIQKDHSDPTEHVKVRNTSRYFCLSNTYLIGREILTDSGPCFGKMCYSIIFPTATGSNKFTDFCQLLMNVNAA